MTEDPIKDGLNWYAYCGGNPVNAWDPSGLFAKNTVLRYSQTYNADVSKLQNELMWLGYLKPIPDSQRGYYGPKTVAAVKKFQKDAGLKVDGIVGKNTWSALGLKFDNDYEKGIYKPSEKITNKGCYIELNSFKIENGINIFGADVGIGGIEGDYKYFGWNLDCVSGSAELGVTSDFVGINVGTSLVKAGAEIKVPIPFTDKKLIFGGEGELFAVGYRIYYDNDSKKLKLGVSSLVGGSVIVGIE